MFKQADKPGPISYKHKAASVTQILNAALSSSQSVKCFKSDPVS